MRSIEAGRPNPTTKEAPLLGILQTESTWQAQAEPTSQKVEPDRSLGITPPASEERSARLLNRVSTLITKDTFTKQDFGKVLGLMKEAAGSIKLGDGESLTTVPNLVPKDRTDEIAIQTGPDGLNVVYLEKVDDDKYKNKLRTVKRVVVGSDFSNVEMTVDATSLDFRGHNVGEATIQGEPTPVVIRPEEKNEDGTVKKTPFDYEAAGKDVATDLFVAYKAAKGLIAIEEALELRDHIKAGDVTAQELQNA